MSLELIYTSAPRGLSSTASGFCTVAATGGMSRQVQTALEGLSGYQFHFNLSDERANLNPVNFAHTRVRIGSETRSVLSRIAFAGADYSGRTNKIAHHLLLERDEQMVNGPAWMMMAMARGVFVAGWQREPGNLPKRSMTAALSSEPRGSEPATTWQAVTGDAGWAGALVQAYRTNPKVPAYVIFEPGQELLPLFEESLAVLPPEDRWQVGFATYYTTLPAGCHYPWRGVVAGSRAAQEIRRFPNATVIDLTSALGPAADSPFAEAARTGQVLQPRETARPSRKVRIKKDDRRPKRPAVPAGNGIAAVLPMAEDVPSDAAVPDFSPEPLPPRPPKRRRSRTVAALITTVAILGTALAASLIGNIMLSRALQEARHDDQGVEVAKGPEQEAPVPERDPQESLSGQQAAPDSAAPPTKSPDSADTQQPGTSPPDTVEPPKDTGGTTPQQYAPPEDPTPASTGPPEGPVEPQEKRTEPPPGTSEEPGEPSKRVENAIHLRMARRAEVAVQSGFSKPKRVVVRDDVLRFEDLGRGEEFLVFPLPATIANQFKVSVENDVFHMRMETSIGYERDVLNAWVNNKHHFVCELSRNEQVKQKADAFLKWGVIQLADRQNRLYNCLLGGDKLRAKVPKQLGFECSKDSPLKPREVSVHLAYPWPEALQLVINEEDPIPVSKLPFRRQVSWLAKSSGDKDKDRDFAGEISLTGTADRGVAVSVVFDTNKSIVNTVMGLRTGWQQNCIAIGQLKSAIESCKGALDGKLTAVKRQTLNSRLAQNQQDLGNEQMQKANKEADVKKVIEAAKRAIRDKSRLVLIDPWGIDVLTINLSFLHCDAKCLLGASPSE